MNELRRNFVERIKEGYIKRREEDFEFAKGDKPFDMSEETIDKELQKQSDLLKSGIVERGCR